MRILCSNDDGIHAKGFDILEEIASALGAEVWTVAPEVDQSGMSRSITLTRPLRIRKVAERRFAVDGTPTDCVQLGVNQILKDKAPDLILSGVNNGQNVADDVTMSGTLAAAFQGMTLGIPSIGLSQSRSDRNRPHWQTALTHAPDVIRKLLEAGWPPATVINLNFPDCPPQEVEGVAVTRQGRRENMELFTEERMDLRQRRYYWFGFSNAKGNHEAGTDLHALDRKEISVTPLHLSLTHEATRASLAESFGAT